MEWFRIQEMCKEKKETIPKIRCNFVMPEKLYKVAERVSKDIFQSMCEFYRFCVINTLIHLSESELIEKLELYDIKRYIKINEKEVEINGNIYSMVSKKGG